MGGLRGLTRVFSFIRLAVLARLLSPFEFGLFGIASLVLALLETLTDTGVNVFFIQKEGEIEEYINTAWIVSILRGILISAVLFLFAPIVGDFFRSPDSTYLVRLIALASFLRGFINPAEVRFQKDLQFKKEFIFRIVSVVADVVVSIIIAVFTKSAVALVWGMIAGITLELLISHLLISPRPRFTFESLKFKRVINRGKWVTLAGIFQYLFANGDNIVVGRLLETVSLGYYQMAYRISTIPITEISDVFAKVTFPTYSNAVEDKAKLKSVFYRLFLMTFVIVFPIGLILFVFTTPIVKFILGDEWLVIIPTLKVLSIFGVVRALESTTPSLFLALKKQEYVTVVTLVSILGMAIPIVPLVLRFGIIGASYSVLIGSLVSLPLFIYYFVKVF